MTNYETAAKEYGSVMFEGKEYALTSQAEFEYRSHINGMTALSPNNYMSAQAIDTDENTYTVWWFIDDEHINDEDMSDATDWMNPSDVVMNNNEY